MIQEIKEYVSANAVPLFKCDEVHPLKALFDRRGFYFSSEAIKQYNILKHDPHLYVAYTDQKEGFYYVGKSYQRGGRWKRGEAYHLGALACHILDSTNGRDQNHSHWVKAWMDEETKLVKNEPYSIHLRGNVFVSFVPFKVYSNMNFSDLTKDEIRQINACIERELILSYKDDGFTMLNVHHNRAVNNSTCKDLLTRIWT